MLGLVPWIEGFGVGVGTGTSTSKNLFKAVVEAINQHAFETSE